MVRAVALCTVVCVCARAADRLEIALCEEAVVDARSLAVGKAAVDTSLNRAGVWVTWRECAPADTGTVPRITVRVRRAPQAVDGSTPVWVSGRAFRVLGFQDYAEVFYDAIAAYAASAGVREGDALACSILHEVGHLLGNPDSRRGLMAETVQAPERELMAHGKLRFTRAEALVIVQELRRRMRQQQANQVAKTR